MSILLTNSTVFSWSHFFYFIHMYYICSGFLLLMLFNCIHAVRNCYTYWSMYIWEQLLCSWISKLLKYFRRSGLLIKYSTTLASRHVNPPTPPTFFFFPILSFIINKLCPLQKFNKRLPYLFFVLTHLLYCQWQWV